jgi:oxalate decarboxylase/phosphoglucose isomerase-like protein (cupin superfamily)
MTEEEAAMADPMDDAAAAAMVDGNAIAGMLAAVFGEDVTMTPGRCAHCHTVSMVGELHAYVRGPGRVLRCPACHEVVLRVVETTDSVYVDVRGASYLRFPRR